MLLAASPLPPALCLMGPTASGKTDLAVALAARFPVEIISVDSALVYCGMDIGTAKPDAATLARAPHHLIDLIDPTERYSAARFRADALRLLSEIGARGGIPLLVGGTMLYFKALMQGIDAMPSADAAVRATIELEALEKGWPALHAELALVDPVSAARLHPSDSQRIARALEVFRLSGQPLSSFHQQRNRSASSHSAHHPRGEGANRTLLISLEPLNRTWLHQRIAERFDAMLASGFLEEVKTLRARGDLHADLPAMRCVGYRQAWHYLDTLEAHPLDHIPALADLRDQGICATRQLAKRQLTWLRSMPQRRVVACDASAAAQQVLTMARAFVDEC